MEAVITSETSVNLYHIIWRIIPEDSHLHIRRREYLKSHQEEINSASKYITLKSPSIKYPAYKNGIFNKAT
jgi:hypothetical protein